LHNYELLRYRRSQGYWVDWAGKDGRVVNAGMCGSFRGRHHLASGARLRLLVG
jgi:hypothetical protein